MIDSRREQVSTDQSVVNFTFFFFWENVALSELLEKVKSRGQFL